VHHFFCGPIFAVAITLSSGQGIFHLLQNWKVLTVFTKVNPLFPVLSQMIHVHSIIAHSFGINFNYFLTSHQYFEYPIPNGLLPSDFPTKIPHVLIIVLLLRFDYIFLFTWFNERFDFDTTASVV
jgi:hypothetical protein